MTLSATALPPTDFDFMIDHWNVAHWRLKERLCGCTDWTEFEGRSSTAKILGGFGNIEDNLLHFPEESFRAVALRSYNVSAGTWSIWWLDGRFPGQLDTPVVGAFADGIGLFFADDVFEGRPVRVRFTWLPGDGSRPRWEQALSDDDGLHWETNWIMEFNRAAS